MSSDGRGLRCRGGVDGPVTLTKRELDEFFAEVTGDDWYVDEWNLDDDAYAVAGPSALLTLESLLIGWQGVGAPRPTKWLTLDAYCGLIDGLAVLRTWLEKRRTSDVVIRVPLAHLDALLAIAQALGAERVA